MTIRLYNTKTRQKERFTPYDASNVRMYVCGPTVYDRAHIGNARPVVVFDVLYRLLRHVYGADHVTYARNFTDVDDKIIKRASESGREIAQITQETIAWYHADMAALGTLRPDLEPRATAHIGDMVAMITALIDKGHAYTAQGHVLFAVESFEAYGALSGRSVKDMIAGARVEVAPYKKNPMDFVLWKPSVADQPGWDSPWGRGRPGWHIECSAMSYELLGAQFDIHGGGLDLQFPHHENEIAQSCACYGNDAFARVWLHNEMLQVEGRKMSKSLGNFFSVREVLDKGVPGEVMRFVYLSTHYRKPMDWTEKKAREAEATLRKWYAQVAQAEADGAPDEAVLNSVFNSVLNSVADDLNTAGAIAHCHRLSHANDGAALAGSLRFLGLMGADVPDWAAAPTVDLSRFEALLLTARTHAMTSKDFSEVDRIKAVLLGAGVQVQMAKSGVELMPKPEFDPAKLEGLT